MEPSLTYLRPEVAALKQVLDKFVENECIPCELEYDNHLKDRHGVHRWSLDAIPPCLHRLKKRSKELGLWNLFIPPHLLNKIPDPSLAPGIKGGLSYREYGILCESLGRCPSIAPEACNTSAPDTGNMEVLLEFGTELQRERYLVPLLRGEIRSCFLMTEPGVASSDPTNLEASLVKRIVNGNIQYELTGCKWWSTGAMDPRCRLALVVARMDYSHMLHESNSTMTAIPSLHASSASLHGAHTVVTIALPHPGVLVERALTVFGYDDAPSGHAQVRLDRVVLTEQDLILGEGSGFRVSQARLGPGRIHHCMRAIGLAARCYELMLQRSIERSTFGKKLYEHGGCQNDIADSLIDLQTARLLTLNCAYSMDTVGTKHSRDLIALIKVAVPQYTFQVVDRTIQTFGAAGLSDVDTILARASIALRTLRIADGPDAVHRRTIARVEIQKAKALKTKMKLSSRL